MDKDRYSVIRQVFLSARDLVGDSQQEYLEQACSDDPDLRAEVEALLKDETRSVAATAALEPRHPEDDELVGMTIGGRFRLVRLIGEGGFGLVYEGEQEQPVRRRVAVKILRRGMDSKEVLARFEAERQALAVMEHPGIARVLDAGTTADGRPYFVMELVRGERITDYCRSRTLSIRERVTLFVDVCNAVNHAHQKGVIHRDIKPSNVLVGETDGVPAPKVIDFGIAKAVHTDSGEQTGLTIGSQLIGTPAYMSPEQATLDSNDVDTRSDIYSLGVLLYELLTGTTPFDDRALRKAGLGEMLRVIREDTPPKPSTRASRPLAPVGGPRDSQTRSRSIQGRPGLRGDLDWIVMMCLEKDRARRYQTASSLGADLTRFLSNQAVEAGPPSGWYRARKLVRRHWVPFAAAATVCVAVLVTMAALGVGYANAERERRRTADALESEQRARQVANDLARFLSDEVLAAPRPSGEEGRGIDTRMRDVLTHASDKAAVLEASAMDDLGWLVAGTVRRTLGDTYRAVGEIDLAEPEFVAALACFERAADPTGVVQASMDLASVLEDRHDFFAAVEAFRAAYEVGQRELAPNDEIRLFTLANYARSLCRVDRVAEALPLLRQAVEDSRRIRGPAHVDTLRAMSNLASGYSLLGKFDESEQTYLSIIAITTSPGTKNTVEEVTARNNLANLYRQNGRDVDALTQSRLIAPRVNSLFGPTHPNSIAILNNHGGILRDTGSPGEALEIHRKLLSDIDAASAGTWFDRVMIRNNIALDYGELEKFEPAVHHARWCVTALVDGLGTEQHEFVARARLNLARLMSGSQQLAEAESELLEAEQIARSASGPGAQVHSEIVEALVALYEEWDDEQPGSGYGAAAHKWRLHAEKEVDR